MREDPLHTKSYEFALLIIKVSRQMQDVLREYVLSKQLLRSGTAVGALIREAEFGQSRRDFVAKMSVALKEANETEYWLRLTKDSGLLNGDQFRLLADPCRQLIAMLAATVKTAASRQQQGK